jgi:hypothetical protein
MLNEGKAPVPGQGCKPASLPEDAKRGPEKLATSDWRNARIGLANNFRVHLDLNFWTDRPPPKHTTCATSIFYIVCF